jgi:aryl-alcohol dehydrogenase-like predicted oxidoreductase
MTPVEELMRALDDLKSAKLLYIGISDAPAWFIAKANTIADLLGWTPFASIQQLLFKRWNSHERKVRNLTGWKSYQHNILGS